jgi:hypothetical protein
MSKYKIVCGIRPDYMSVGTHTLYLRWTKPLTGNPCLYSIAGIDWVDIPDQVKTITRSPSDVIVTISLRPEVTSADFYIVLQ